MFSKPVIGIEFYNRTATRLLLWLELCCEQLELQPGVEYRLESTETEYRLEFTDELITLYYQYRFGPKILKRPHSPEIHNPAAWEVVEDYSRY